MAIYSSFVKMLNDVELFIYLFILLIISIYCCFYLHLLPSFHSIYPVGILLNNNNVGHSSNLGIKCI